MLFDPFEEQLDLPSTLVERRNGEWGQCCVVGEEDKRLAGLGVFESHSAQVVLGIVFGDVMAVHGDGLIADYAVEFVARSRVDPAGIHIGLGSGDKEGSALMHREESCKIQVTAIHHVESTSLDGQEVQHVDIVQLAVADVNEGGNGSSQIEQGMQLDRSFGASKRCPLEQAQAQIDGRCVQGVDGVVEIEPQIGIGIELAGAANQHRRQIRPDTPIAGLVRVGQGRAMDRVAQAHRVKLARIGTERDLDIAQALAPSQLSKGHRTKLFGTAQSTHTRVARVSVDDASKAGPRNELHQLRKQCLARIHGASPKVETPENDTEMANQDSNRHQIKSTATPRQHWLYAKPMSI